VHLESDFLHFSQASTVQKGCCWEVSGEVVLWGMMAGLDLDAVAGGRVPDIALSSTVFCLAQLFLR